MLLFFFHFFSFSLPFFSFFFREIPENVLLTAAKSSHERALRQCVCFIFFVFFPSPQKKTLKKENRVSQNNNNQPQ